MKCKKVFAALTAACLAASAVYAMPGAAEAVPSPVISRSCPAYAGASPSTAASANDPYYYSFWTGSAADYLAYDLSAVPAAERQQVLAVWYNATANYDPSVLQNGGTNGVPSDYTVEVNKAPGGAYPESGWEVVETVTGNTLHSRQHLVDLSGYNWIRLNIAKADGKEGGSVQINFDVHNVSDGTADSWIFFGDSITAGGMMNCYGTGFAELIHEIDSRYFPVQENGGIGGIRSTEGVANIERWLSTYDGTYVSLAYGTNDAWGNQTGAKKYYENTVYMIEKILDAGKIPVLPKIPYATNPDVNRNLDEYNAAIDQIYAEYSQVIPGPDFDAYFRENPDMLSADGVHPSAEGYAGMRQLWAETMYQNVYTASGSSSGTGSTPGTDHQYAQGDVNRDGTVDIKDAKLLADYLVRKVEYVEKGLADMNQDGTVNVYDLRILKQQLNKASEPSGDVKTSVIAISGENAKLQSRTVTKNDTLWLVQSGSAAEFTVTGTKATVKLAGDGSEKADPDHRPRYAVYVDDTLVAEKTIDSAEEEVTLFSGSSSVTKEVKVIQISEAMYGAVGIRSLTVDSGAAKPVKPLPKRDLKIEFIGDSITCAYGVESAGSSEPFKTTTENFTKSYAYLTAQLLNADYSTVCYSGHGIISGYTSSAKNTESLIPDCYEVASKQGSYGEAWDFSANPNDVVVLNLGTNDSSYITADGKAKFDERVQEYIDGYVAFLKTLRKKNPDAYIVCTLGTMDFENIYQYADQAVAAYQKETGDQRICFYQSVMQSASDGYGADWHPSAITQRNISYVLADKICQALGMESSQIGLNVVADAEYALETNAASGANAAFYVNDYDKSVWINTVSGGKAASDLQATLSGIGLKAGGTYQLEFDIVSGKELSIPVKIAGSKEYFSDTVKAGAEKVHYAETFTCSGTDSGAQLQFHVGGADSCTITLTNIKLTKIS